MPAPSRDSYAAHIQSVAPDHADWLIPLLRPAIGINAFPATQEEILVGASKFGGAPDLPAGTAWPTFEGVPLYLIAQFNLAEIAPFDLEQRLPSHGLLSFFFAYEVWGMENRPLVHWFPEGPWYRPPLPTLLTPGHRRFWPEDEKLLASRQWWTRVQGLIKTFNGKPYPKCPPIPSCRLDFDVEWQLPHPEDPKLVIPLLERDHSLTTPIIAEPDESKTHSASQPDLPPELWQPDHDSKTQWSRWSHQLLGHPCGVQGDPHLGAAMAEIGGEYDYQRALPVAREWDLLFQQNDGDGWEWQGGGAIYYLLRPEHLDSRRFDQVNVQVEQF